ncbi:hypothetical protein IEQ34_016713 [Dendrobium chrysotoxum]|uniref:Uncharacterized protein n=1 Tax=Dendrobium chrysotoxum TaxID=161865 RepID=A0AAV7GGI6_DENCH|nr:hypothetical protein IEQ34_016713 [Dendrobium chrysotoxum]
MEKPVLATGRLEDRVPLSDVVADCVRRWFRDTLEEAKTGDAMMQVLVGQMYQSGYGVPRNEQKVRFTRICCARVYMPGDVIICIRLMHGSQKLQGTVLPFGRLARSIQVIMLVIQILMRLAWRRANSCLTWMHYFGGFYWILLANVDDLFWLSGMLEMIGLKEMVNNTVFQIHINA